MASQLRELLGNEATMLQVSNQAFDNFDTDHSGYVDKAELKQMLDYVATEYPFTVPSDEDLTRILQALDVDSNGRVTKDEFLPLVKSIFQEIIEMLEGR